MAPPLLHCNIDIAAQYHKSVITEHSEQFREFLGTPAKYLAPEV
jgi:hypothetical protein